MSHSPLLAGIQIHEQESEARLKAFDYFRAGARALAVGDVRTQALDAFDVMHKLATRIHDAELTALALVGLSATYDLLGRRHDSLSAARRAQRLARATGNERLEALALNAEAQFLKETGRNPEALALFRRVEETGRRLNDDRLVMAGLIGRGRTTAMHQFEAAVGAYQQATEIAQTLGDRVALAVCYNNLADWMIYGQKYEDAIRLREQSMAISQTLGSRIGVGRALIGIAKAETLLERYDRAWDFLRQGLPYILSTGDMEGELHAYLNLAHLYAREGDIPRACDYYQRTLDKSLEAPDSACATFAQAALELLCQGALPRPGILPERQVGSESGAFYPTGDMGWSGIEQP